MDKILQDVSLLAAIKLIEVLYKNGKIAEPVFRKIVDEYSEMIDTSLISWGQKTPYKEE